jgi:flagellar hook-associated protein 3 FlgL
MTSSSQLGSARLDMAQTALGAASETAQDFLKQILAAKGGIASASVLKNSASQALQGLASQLNTNAAGVYVFAGDNAAEAPFANYFSDGSSARPATAAAFETAFGMTQASVGVSAITPDQMQSFIDGAFAALFEDANWQSNWSSASPESPRMRISGHEMVEVGASAAEEPFRQLAEAYALVADLGGERLDPRTQKVIIERASGLVSSAIAGIASIQSRLGLSQARISAADASAAAEGAVLVSKIASMRKSDPYEAATVLNTLTVQLQASFAATARIHAMTLANYL